MRTILLKFAGPLQSWGTSSHFETRQTDLYPSKSAVLGLIAASYGFRRNNDEKIVKLNDLDFAIRIDQPGKILRDYHTARKYKANGDFDRTYVTNRYYLEDAIFVVAIGHEDERWIDEIFQVLKNPYFSIYMGRRSLPVTADFILDIDYLDTITMLKNLEWQASSWYQKKQKDWTYLTIYADSYLLKDSGKSPRRDRVLSFNQKNRQFSYRYESRIEVPLIRKKPTEHDIFNAVGGD